MPGQVLAFAESAFGVITGMLWLRLLLICCCCLPAWSREQETNALTLDELRAELAAHVNQARFEHGMWGIQVVSLASGRILFEHNEGKLLKPASNAKLFTGALALDTLGPDYRIRTSVYAAQKPGPDGTLEGDLIIFGRGDPTFAARFRNGDYEGLLRPLAEAIREAGVRRVTGALVGNETWFIGPPYGSTWSWDDLQYYYGAQVSALTVQDNVIDIFLKPGSAEGEPCEIMLKPETDFVRFINRTATGSTESYAATRVYRPLGRNVAYIEGRVPLGSRPHDESVSVHNPALWFVTLLKEELARAEVEVEGPLRTRSWPEDARTEISGLVELASVESPPLAEILPKMLKPSQNLYAQLLFLQAGAQLAKEGDTNTWTEELGVKQLRRFGERAGIHRAELRLEEGSGLSRAALVTPRAVVQLLVYMREHPDGELFLESLPIAGVDGTLRNRMKEAPLHGNVRAKTGTIRYVNTLSGYMETHTGEPLAFALMLNAYQPPAGAPSARADLDQVLSLLWCLKAAGSADAGDSR